MELEYPSENILGIIIGVKDYTNPRLHKLEAAENNAIEFKKSLKKRYFKSEKYKDDTGIPDGNIQMLLESAIEPQGVRGVIKKFLDGNNTKRVDLIIFYYSGHGIKNVDNGNYYLALKDTKEEDLNETALAISRIHDLLFVYSKKVVFILDACFSENAFNSIDSQSDFYIMASSAYNTTTKYPQGQELSPFTGNYLETIKMGINGGGQFLTFDEIYKEVKSKLEAKDFPSPRKINRNECGDIIFCKNSCNDQFDIPQFDLEGAFTTLYNAFYKKEEFDDRRKPMKLMVLKCFPVNIAIYLRNILSDNGLINNESFLQGLYYQIVHFLSFLFIKNLGKKTNDDLFKDWKNEKDSKKLNSFHVSIVEKACSEYKELLFDENLKRNASLLLSRVQAIEALINEKSVIEGMEFVRFRNHLFGLLAQLSFLRNYQLLAVRFIDAKKSFSGRTIFRHEVSSLFGEEPDSYSFLELMASEGVFLFNAVVLIPKVSNCGHLNKIIIDNNFINLWPFIIDGCGNDRNAEKPQICMFEDVTMENGFSCYNYKPVQFKRERENKREYGSFKAYPDRDELILYCSDY